MDYALKDTDEAQQQFPLQLQLIIDQINSAYAQLDQAEADFEEQIKYQLKLKRKDQVLLNKIRSEIEKVQIQQIETIRGLTIKLKSQSSDALISLTDSQYNNLQVILSRYKQLINGKQKSLQQLVQQLSKIIANSQFQDTIIDDEVETQQNEKIQLISNELAKHEEELDRDQKDINQIHKDVNEIVGLIDTISTEVQNQGEIVNRIEAKVVAADQDMDDGIDKLLAAQKDQKLSKKAKWLLAILAIIAAIVVVIVVLVLVFRKK
ncbi:SNARE [Hexamita inflata]|uniref:Putative n=1 Tax=Hexamita inflata TaxID=28002 RepID=A0AA86NXX4_9EUKA|nr:SNARE [Hexamita inflata]